MGSTRTLGIDSASRRAGHYDPAARRRLHCAGLGVTDGLRWSGQRPSAQGLLDCQETNDRRRASAGFGRAGPHGWLLDAGGRTGLCEGGTGLRSALRGRGFGLVREHGRAGPHGWLLDAGGRTGLCEGGTGLRSALRGRGFGLVREHGLGPIGCGWVAPAGGVRLGVALSIGCGGLCCGSSSTAAPCWRRWWGLPAQRA